MNTNMHTDIKKNSWIVASLPQAARPYAYLARLDRPIGIWLLLLPGWWAILIASGGLLAMNLRDWWIFILFALGAIIMRSAGCVINDLWDRDFDRKIERTRTRPLAAGDLSFRQGFIFLLILLCLGFLILLQMGVVTVFLGILSLPLIGLYPLMKRWTWWPQAFLGLTFNFGILMGWSAVTGILEVPALILYAGGLLWTIGYDTIYAHQDKEGDTLIGVRSTALKFGKNSKKWVAGFYMATIFLMALGGLQAEVGLGFYGALTPAAAHLFFQLKNWDEASPTSALYTFKSNRNFGFLVLLACALSGL